LLQFTNTLHHSIHLPQNKSGRGGEGGKSECKKEQGNERKHMRNRKRDGGERESTREKRRKKENERQTE